MTKLPNYLYKYILKFIINSIYANDEFYQNNNEAIQLSCVCKDYFKYISQLLGNRLNEYNYERMFGLIEFQSTEFSSAISTKLSNTSNNILISSSIENFKLIKSKDSIMVYDYFDESDDEPSGGNGLNDGSLDRVKALNIFKSSLALKKIYLNAYSNSACKVILEMLDQIPDNIVVNIYYEFFKKEQFKLISQYSNKINKYDCANVDINGLYSLLETPPRKVIYSVSHDYNEFLHSINFLFKFKLSSKNLINIDDLLFPHDLQNNNSTSKLSGLYLYTNVQNMLASVPVFSNSVLDKWNYIVNRLSSDKTLITFKFTFGHEFYRDNVLGEEEFYKGLKSVLVNQETLKVFELYLNTLINQYLLEGLALNKSISTLVVSFYSNQNISLIIDGVLLLNKNKSVRNLSIIISNTKFNNSNTDVIVWLTSFCRFKEQLDLYSLSIHFNRSFSLTSYIDFIKSNSFQINVFNLYKYGGSVKYQVLSNSSLINITE